MTGISGFIIRDGGTAAPSQLGPGTKGFVTSSGKWKPVPNSRKAIAVAAALLSQKSATVQQFFIEGYSDVSGTLAIILNGVVIVAGSNETETGSSTNALLGYLFKSAPDVQPRFELAHVRSVWDLIVPVGATASAFFASSTLTQPLLPGGSFVWDSVGVTIIAAVGVIQWFRKG